MAVFEVPLIASPQSFSIVLAGVSYQMTVVWRQADQGGWFLDIADAGGSPMVGGIPLVTGADLLAQYGYLGFGGTLTVSTDHETNAVPTYENLGGTSHLFFTVPDA